MLKYDREKDQNGNYTYGKYGISNLSKAQEKLIDGLAEYGQEVGERGRLPRDGRGDGKACRYQQGHRENRRATCSEAFQRLGDGALRSGFWLILAKRTGRKLQVFVPSA